MLVTIRQGRANDLPVIINLLKTERLPTADLTETMLSDFVIASINGETVGCIGLEICTTTALLRSLIVLQSYRGQGISNQLFNHITSVLHGKKVSDVYLLTDTAFMYFLHKGFKEVSRNNVPDELKKLSEFTQLCPDKAHCMHLKLK